jgi:hypothetical protein
MKRRQILLGIGVTAGGGSIVSSGAFTSVEADRTADVAVADDTDAFLRIGPCTDDSGNPLPNAEYVQLDNGTMTLDLTGDNETSGGGVGVNAGAVSRFDDVFEIRNQGTQPIGVWLEAAEPVMADVDGDGENEPRIEFYRSDDPNSDFVADGSDLNAKCLDVGESICIGFIIRTEGLDDDDDEAALFDTGTLPGGNDEELVVNGDADVGCEVPSGGSSLQRVWANGVDNTSTDLGTEKDGSSLDSARDDPAAATGAPNSEFVSLGFPQGQLVVEFTGANGPLVSHPSNPDLVVEEITGGRSSYPEENATVEAEVMPPGGGWQSLGTATSKASGGANEFDFGSGVDEVEKVRIRDDTDPSGFPDDADGFDVDAVGGWTER